MNAKPNPGELTNQCEYVRLGDLCDVVNGFGFPEHLQGRKNLPYPFIKVSDMNAEGAETVITSAVNTVDDDILDILRAKTYPPGTVVFPKVGGALLTNKKRMLGVRGVFDNNVMGLVPKGIEPEWLFLWIQTVDLRMLANTQALPSIRQTDVANLNVPVPIASERKRITALLNQQIEAVGAARRAAKEQLSAARTLPAAYLRQVFENEEVKLWPKRKLREILTLRRDVIYPKDNPTGEAVFVGLEHVESLTGRRTGALVLRKEELTGRKPQFFRGDIVYGYLRPYLNKLWIAEFDGLCSVDQYVYSVDGSEADTEFVAWFMRSPLFLKRAPIDITPGQLPRIRTDEVANVDINLPDLEKQRSIAKSLNDKIVSSIEMITNAATRIESLDFLSAALLRHAFSGTV